MSLHFAVAVCQDFLRSLLEVVDRLPAPAIGALLIAAGVCIYESLGNKRLMPGTWR
jgi:hypothetical protein